MEKIINTYMGVPIIETESGNIMVKVGKSPVFFRGKYAKSEAINYINSLYKQGEIK